MNAFLILLSVIVVVMLLWIASGVGDGKGN